MSDPSVCEVFVPNAFPARLCQTCQRPKESHGAGAGAAGAAEAVTSKSPLAPSPSSSSSFVLPTLRSSPTKAHDPASRANAAAAPSPTSSLPSKSATSPTYPAVAVAVVSASAGSTKSQNAAAAPSPTTPTTTSATATNTTTTTAPPSSATNESSSVLAVPVFRPATVNPDVRVPSVEEYTRELCKRIDDILAAAWDKRQEDKARDQGHQDQHARLARILAGKLSDHDRPDSHIVRVFVSSTFTDTEWERNWIMQFVNPRLVAWCAQHFLLSFQVVDMRWGVRDEATDEHQTSQLCMHELAECQRLSMAATFISLQSHKYGYRPFPPRIDAAEYRAMFAAVTDEADRALLSTWFKEDLNAKPVEFVLQPINTILGNGWRQDKALSGKWWEIFEAIQRILRSAASKTLIPERAHVYLRSVTEEEVEHGVVEERPALLVHRVFWLWREIEGLLEHTSDNGAGKFIDIDWKTKAVDSEAAILREKLVRDCMARIIPASNVRRFAVPWVAGGIDVALQSHAEHCAAVCEAYTQFVSNSIAEAHTPTKLPSYATEALAHMHQARSMAQRATVVQTLHRRLIDELRAGGGKVYVLQGAAGTGKTVMASILATEACLRDDIVVCARFVGLTSGAGRGPDLVYSVCQQLSAIFDGQPQSVPTDPAVLPRELKVLLGAARPEKRILLILDSLDSVQDATDVFAATCVPTAVPPNVLILVTTSSVGEGFGSVIRDHLKESLPAASFLRLEPLTSEVGNTMLSHLLSQNSRSLIPSQQEVVIQKFESAGMLPLYLRVAASFARGWASYTPSETVASLPDDVSALVQAYFKMVEMKHGTIFVSHALALISCARLGLAMDELFEILNVDETVLSSVFQYWTPPDRKIPVLLFTRVRFEFGHDLVESGASNVLSWGHSVIAQGATSRFLGTPELMQANRTSTIKMFTARLEKAEQLLLPASQRVAEELPWLLAQVGDFDTLRRVLASPSVFSVMHQRYVNGNFDLPTLWARLNVDRETQAGLIKTMAGDLENQLRPLLLGKAQSSRNCEYLAHLNETLFCAGQFLDDAGCYQAAIECYDLLRPYLSLLPCERECSLTNNKAVCLWRLSMISEAEATYMHAMELWEKTPEGPERTKAMAKVWNNLGSLYMEDRRYPEGEQAFAKSLAFYLACKDATLDVEIAGVKNNMGIVCRFQGKMAEALALYLEALETREAVYGKRHPKTAETLNALGSVCLGEKKFDEARPYFTQTLEISCELLGPKNIACGRAYYNLALVEFNTSQWQAAAAALERAHEIYAESFGPGAPPTLDAIGMLVDVHLNAGSHADARDAILALATAVRRDNAGTVVFVQRMFPKAKALRAIGYAKEAAALYLEMGEVCVGLFGLAHPTTLTVLTEAGVAQRARKAVEGNEKAYAIAAHNHPLRYQVVGVGPASGLPQHGCEKCHAAILTGLPLFRCAACDYDICSPCSREIPDLANQHEHPLVRMQAGEEVTGYPGHTCDVCGNAADWVLYRCVECGFDACLFCFLKDV